MIVHYDFQRCSYIKKDKDFQVLIKVDEFKKNKLFVGCSNGKAR
jgi:hypothetical protein